jgi:MFS family permease
MRKISSRWWIVFLLFSGMFVNAIDRYSLSTAAPFLMDDLHLDKAHMGIVLSAFFWFYMLMNVPAGFLADKYGAKRTLGWAAALWSVCSSFTGIARSFLHLILARVGVGAGEAAGFPVNAKIVNNHFQPRERGLATGCYNAGLRLGFAVTPILMARLIKNWGWRFAFYATGIGSLAWVAVWYFTYVETAPGDSTERSVPARPRIPVLTLLRNRTVAGLVLTKFFQDYLFYLFVTWLPGYLVLERGFSIIKMGWCASLPWVAGCIAQPLAGWVSDRFIRRGMSVTFSRKSIVITMYLLSASAVIAGYVNDPMTAVWLLTASVACESAATAILWTACADVAPASAAGSLAGIMNTAGAFAGILAPTVTGFLAQSTGNFQLPLLIGSCMVILAAATIWLVVGELKPHGTLLEGHE